jgi:hypothetical protein
MTCKRCGASGHVASPPTEPAGNNCRRARDAALVPPQWGLEEVPPHIELCAECDGSRENAVHVPNTMSTEERQEMELRIGRLGLHVFVPPRWRKDVCACGLSRLSIVHNCTFVSAQYGETLPDCGKIGARKCDTYHCRRHLDAETLLTEIDQLKQALLSFSYYRSNS